MHFSYLDGGYSDFNINWYVFVAPSFLSPMYIKILLPFIGSGIKISLRYMLWLWDWRFSSVKSRTKTKNAQEYIELYSGPTFNIEEPYPQIMTVVMISMMYGLALPALFPLTFVYLLVIFFLQKILAVYFCSKPNDTDDSLNQNAIYFLKYGSFLFAAFGYWVLTNRSMFYNDIDI